MGIGALREKLVIQENAPDAIAVASLTRVGGTATVTTTASHGYATGDYVQIVGATPTAYNGKWKVTVTAATAFTFPITGTPATPATGTITALYVSDAQGGRKIGWTALGAAPQGIWAELVPLRAVERLQAQALHAQLDYRFRVRARPDITPQMRALWRPSWQPNPALHTLEIHGVLPEGDGRIYMLLEMGELA